MFSSQILMPITECGDLSVISFDPWRSGVILWDFQTLNCDLTVMAGEI